MEAILKDKCDVSICLTHCRMADDVLIAANCPVKLILGGHDHAVVTEDPIWKAGSDWENVVICELQEDKTWKNCLLEIPQDYADHKDVVAVLDEWEGVLKKGLTKKLATLDTPLSMKTDLIRCSESPVGNWICDLVKFQFSVILGRPVDAVLINAGSFRGDNVIDTFTVKELLSLLPFNDLTLGYLVTGPKLIEAMEAGTRSWPAENGGFPAICTGMEVKIINHKVKSFKIHGEELVGGDPEKKYCLVTKSFLAEGKDGYDCLDGHCKPLMDPDCAILLSSLVRSALISANTLKLLSPKKELSARFIDKLRKRDDRVVALNPVVDGRLIIEEKETLKI
jgi:2',3'-cyclic-nucleotide 2'-phosphodiesterase (5'-nucleotidase family)